MHRIDNPCYVTNLWRMVRFSLEGQVLERRLVHQVDDPAGELNAESPVGQVLVGARAGDELTAVAPGGNVVVKVLRIL